MKGTNPGISSSTLTCPALTLIETGSAMGGSVIPEKKNYPQNFPSNSCEIPKFGKTKYT